jgi:hypothetical protein
MTRSFPRPIMLELMTDPVTVAMGKTYDRASSIKKWMKSRCRRTCPDTDERLRSAELVPSLAIHHIVEQLLANDVSLHESNSSKHWCMVDKTVLAFGAAAAGFLHRHEAIAWRARRAAEGDV